MGETVSAAIDRYLLDMQIDRSRQTHTWYAKRLKPLRVLDKPITAVTLIDLKTLYAQLATRQTKYAQHPSGRAAVHEPLSPSTLRGYVRAWRAFFTWLLDTDAITVNPVRKLKLTPVPKQPPKAISQADMEKMVQAARQASPRDYAIVCILVDSACRVGGLCNITLDNLDLDQAQAIVTSKGQLQFLLFTPRTVDAIRAYLIERPTVASRHLFIGVRGQPLQPGGVYQLLKRLATAAHVQGRVNPHAFRHGWARAALQNGADISDVGHVLGHTQIQTTYEYYGRWDDAELHGIHDQYTWLEAEEAETAPD